MDIVQKIWAPLRKLFALPGVPSWLRAWSGLDRTSDFQKFADQDWIGFNFCGSGL